MILNKLEVAETQYISSFKVVETTSGRHLQVGDASSDKVAAPEDYVAPKGE